MYFQSQDGTWNGPLARDRLNISLVSRWLCVLSARPEHGSVRFFVLMPDSLSTDDGRRMRTWLRWYLPDQTEDQSGY